ncbi:MAG: CYTH domain-containing protein [Lachnospiraceae bacterium]|nr:CYTH domain-containing protein [Lachnospiraceae bacterium]
MEIERKFLIKENEFNYKEYPHKLYEQGYLSVDPVVRVRMEGNEYVLTYKGSGMLSREEYNLPLTKESYEHLIKKADGIIIKKNRYFIPFDKYTIELDEFLGVHEGLITAEVEFESEEEALSFTPPVWFGEDVTYDVKYKNSYLSMNKLI